MYNIFKSVLDKDRSPVVICSVNHTVIYMNKSAIRKYGRDLTGATILSCHNARENDKILKVVSWFKESDENNMIYIRKSFAENKDVYMVALRDEKGNLIGYYEKHESRNSEMAECYDFSNSLI